MFDFILPEVDLCLVSESKHYGSGGMRPTAWCQSQVSLCSLRWRRRLSTFISSRLAGRTPGLRLEREAIGRAGATTTGGGGGAVGSDTMMEVGKLPPPPLWPSAIGLQREKIDRKGGSHRQSSRLHFCITMMRDRVQRGRGKETKKGNGISVPNKNRWHPSPVLNRGANEPAKGSQFNESVVQTTSCELEILLDFSLLLEIGSWLGLTKHQPWALFRHRHAVKKKLNKTERGAKVV